MATYHFAGPLLLGEPSGLIVARENTTSVGGGNESLSHSPPDGVFMRVVRAVLWNATANRAQDLTLWHGDGVWWAVYDTHGAGNAPHMLDMDALIHAGETLWATFAACNAGDTVYFDLWAYLYPACEVIT